MTRVVGPLQGRGFITPAAMPTAKGRMSGFMPSFVVMGSMAETEMMKVVVPSPSRETSMASTAAPMVTFTGSPRTSFRILFTMGSKRPASIMMPK